MEKINIKRKKMTISLNSSSKLKINIKNPKICLIIMELITDIKKKCIISKFEIEKNKLKQKFSKFKKIKKN